MARVAGAARAAAAGAADRAGGAHRQGGGAAAGVVREQAELVGPAVGVAGDDAAPDARLAAGDQPVRFNETNHLPYDVIVVDETSMVSLTMMCRLLEAVRPEARLVLVGDPDQLTSVDAGAVLADLVARPVTGVENPVLRGWWARICRRRTIRPRRR